MQSEAMFIIWKQSRPFFDLMNVFLFRFLDQYYQQFDKRILLPTIEEKVDMTPPQISANGEENPTYIGADHLHQFYHEQGRSHNGGPQINTNPYVQTVPVQLAPQYTQVIIK